MHTYIRFICIHTLQFTYITYIYIYGPHIYITHILYMYVMSVHVATMHPVHVVLNRDDTDNFKR